MARRFIVEIETHPVNPEEYRFLIGGGIVRLAGDVLVSPRYALPKEETSANASGPSII
jgi:hypothetical protein